MNISSTFGQEALELQYAVSRGEASDPWILVAARDRLEIAKSNYLSTLREPAYRNRSTAPVSCEKLLPATFRKSAYRNRSIGLVSCE